MARPLLVGAGRFELRLAGADRRSRRRVAGANPTATRGCAAGGSQLSAASRPSRGGRGGRLCVAAVALVACADGRPLPTSLSRLATGQTAQGRPSWGMVGHAAGACRPSGERSGGGNATACPAGSQGQRRVTKCANKKARQLDPRTLQAAQLVMIFTTLPATLLDASGVLELYRYRWQLELACKRLKQLLKLGHLPHQRPDIARTWILAKLVVALLLETLYRNARVFAPWGYRLEALTAAWP